MDSKKLRKAESNRRYRQKLKEKKDEVKQDEKSEQKTLFESPKPVKFDKVKSESSDDEIDDKELDSYLDELVAQRVQTQVPTKSSLKARMGSIQMPSGVSRMLLPLCLPLFTGALNLLFKYVPLLIEQKRLAGPSSNTAQSDIQQQLSYLQSR